MNTISLRKIFNNIIEGKKVDKTLVLPITTIALKEYKKKYNAYFPDIYTDAEKMYKLSIAPHIESKIEGANVPFDMTLEAEALGCTIDLRGGDLTPEVIESPFKNLDAISIPDDLFNTDRIQVFLDTIDLIRENYSQLPIIIGIVGPFTLLGQLIGIEKLLKLLKSELYAIEDALVVLSEAQIEFIKIIEEHDVDAIVVCEPSCTSDLLDPNIFRDIVQLELEEIKENISVASILHICGNTNPIIEDMLSMEFDAISFEDAVDVKDAYTIRENIASSTKLCGNVATNTLLNSSPLEVEKEVKYALDNGIDILCSSCSVPPLTNEENVRCMVESRDKFSS